MKTSIFDMALTLPPMIEMTQVDKDDMALTSPGLLCQPYVGDCYENIHL